jgi:hypothetical protein
LALADRKVRKDSKGRSGRRVALASAVKLVQQVRKERLGRRDRKVKRARRDPLALPVSVAKLDRKVPLVLQASRTTGPQGRPRRAYALPCRYRNGHGYLRG